MSLTLELHADLEKELLVESGRLSLPLADYVLRLLADWHANVFVRRRSSGNLLDGEAKTRVDEHSSL